MDDDSGSISSGSVEEPVVPANELHPANASVAIPTSTWDTAEERAVKESDENERAPASSSGWGKGKIESLLTETAPDRNSPIIEPGLLARYGFLPFFTALEESMKTRVNPTDNQ